APGLPPLPRRHVHRRVLDGLGPLAERGAGGGPARRSPHRALPEARRRPRDRCSAATASSKEDSAWHDLIPFHEYFHGDTGAGLGASHQTGWTGLVADLIVRPGSRPWQPPLEGDPV